MPRLKKRAADDSYPSEEGTAAGAPPPTRASARSWPTGCSRCVAAAASRVAWNTAALTGDHYAAASVVDVDLAAVDAYRRGLPERS